MHHDDCWKPGPLPANTYHWGGAQLKGEEGTHQFHFADFRGDHVILPMEEARRVEKDEIILYNNLICCPNSTFGKLDPSGPVGAPFGA